MIQVVEGSILLTDSNIIVQQVNCINVMGGGLAKQIAQHYPEVKKQYHDFCKSKVPGQLLGDVLHVCTHDNKIVSNVFGQLSIRKGPHDTKVYTDTYFLLKGLAEVKRLAVANQYTIAIPYGIGCGLANGNWDEICPAIEELFADCEHLVKFYCLKK